MSSSPAERVRQVEAAPSVATDGWSAVYEANVDWVYRAIYGRVGNRPDAEDATADVFARALPRLNLAAPAGQVHAYLASTVRSVLVDHWRDKYGHDPSGPSELVAGPVDIDADGAKADNARRADRLLARLPEHYRRVLELRFLQGYSVRETAKALGISVGDAKVLQHRALRRAAELKGMTEVSDDGPSERVDAYVEALVRKRRPPRFAATPEEASILEAANTLAAGRPGADEPDPHFVARLRRRLEQSAAKSNNGLVSRRHLLGRLGIPVAAAALGAAAATAVGWIRDAVDTEDQGLELVPSQGGRWIAVASLASVAPGEPLPFTAGAIHGFVVRTEEGVQALSAVCTHLGCVLSANAAAGRLDCPCHGGSFALDGSSLSSEYRRPLPRLLTRINGDQVEVFAA